MGCFFLKFFLANRFGLSMADLKITKPMGLIVDLNILLYNKLAFKR